MLILSATARLLDRYDPSLRQSLGPSDWFHHPDERGFGQLAGGTPQWISHFWLDLPYHLTPHVAVFHSERKRPTSSQFRQISAGTESNGSDRQPSQARHRHLAHS